MDDDILASEAKRRLNEGATLKSVIAEMGVGYYRLRQALGADWERYRSAAIAKARTSVVDAVQVDKWLRAGMYKDEIAVQLGVCVRTLDLHLSAAVRTGELPPRGKGSINKRECYHLFVNAGWDTARLAERYNVKPQTIESYIRRSGLREEQAARKAA